MIAEIKNAVAQAVECVRRKSNISSVPENLFVEVEIPKNREFGDYSTNVAMILARPLQKSPREVAAIIIDNLSQNHRALFKSIEIKGPGFINFFVHEAVITSKLADIYNSAESFGRSTAGQGKKVLLEFVSANPTGALHMGHARNAAVGDALARILRAVGYDVTTEYYINDAGRQVDMLGRSVFERYKESFGLDAHMPQDGYYGEYIKSIAGEIRSIKGDELLSEGSDEKDSIRYCAGFAKQALLEQIKGELEELGVGFDNWYSEEAELHSGDGADGISLKVKSVIGELEDRGALYKKDGALWFRATEYGDSQDWVLVKSDGTGTYFLNDIAYHGDKLGRGALRLINIWGADHHGHVKRLKSALKALGFEDSMLEVVLIQFVRLMRDGVEVKMSKRAGSYVTMSEVVEEVGSDVARFFLLMRGTDSHLDFDLELAKRESAENPVFYIQYANARIRSVFKKAEAAGISPSPDHLELLTLPLEIEITKKLLMFPDALRESAELLSPHKIVFYLQDIASDFHVYYNKNRIIGDDHTLSQTRLFFAECIRAVVRNGLGLLGVSIPERM
ncbi:MAG: arginine--tRNA ligase [Thermodesulfobacteriota bacterium]